MVAAGSITVAVRVRPPNAWEAARLPEKTYEAAFRGDGALSSPTKVVNMAPLRDIVQVIDDRILTFDPQEKDPARAFAERGFMPPGTKRYKDKRFMFDKVLDHEAQQRDVYESTTKPLLKGLFDGYNSTVFAYGATGCGKTHTISGTDTDPGIIYLTMADLFQMIEDRKEDWNIDVVVTFLEIYNEEIRDLLAEPGSHMPRGGLSIREDKTVKVVGLAELKPKSADEVKEIVLLGNSRRTQSPTHANETSSRSHAVLQIHITQGPRTASLTEQKTMGTLSIIDLAGSERAAATTNMGQRMVEGANINKSLLALGNCINALCESGGAIRHVPYRNSKLTRLLKFSLGGNCKTVMIVCVAPTSNHFDDTHNTLVYAERATKIKTRVVTRNVLNVDRHVGQYVEAINRLNAEIAELKAKLAGKRDSENDIARRKKAEAAAEVGRTKDDMDAKVDQTRDIILDGAMCSGNITVAKTKLSAIQNRLQQIGPSGSSALPADLAAEQALLQALAAPQEEAIKPGSLLNTRLQRSSNSAAMFEATMRAVSERKSDKLDELSVDNIKLDARYRKAEMERLKAESERDVMRDAVEEMAKTMVNLVGMLGRCTVMVGEAADTLGSSREKEEFPSIAQGVATSLGRLRSSNDQAFKDLVGASTDSYSKAIAASSSLDTFSGYPPVFSSTRRIASGPAILQQMQASSSRRSSTFGSTLAPPAEPRRSGRSPRKSLRSSLSQPYRRLSTQKAVKAPKNVQWRDEVGGDLEDASLRSPSVVVTVIPSENDPPTAESSMASSSASDILPPRSTSLGSSESDWEDETERTEDSVNISLSVPPAETSFLSASTSRPLTSKRTRPSRLDPSFLKSSRGRHPTLSSLAEGDETASPERRNSNPLSDVSMNRLDSDRLHVPKARDRAMHSPVRRGPSTLNKPPPTPRTNLRTSARRRSNIGPVRVEKGRRRSSLIPQLSPRDPDGTSISAARRMPGASPAKRARRVSITKSGPGTGSARLRSSVLGNSSFSASTSDPNSSNDLNMSRTSRKKATWR